MKKLPFNSYIQQNCLPSLPKGGGQNAVFKEAFLPLVPNTEFPLCPQGDWRHRAGVLQESS